MWYQYKYNTLFVLINLNTEVCIWGIVCPFHWRYNEQDGVSNHRRLDWLLNLAGANGVSVGSSTRAVLNRLFRGWSRKTLKLCVTGLCEGIHRWLLDSPHKGPVTRKIFPFEYIIMQKQVSMTITSNYIPQIMWNVITCSCHRYLLLWNVITSPCPRYRLLAQKFIYVTVSS